MNYVFLNINAKKLQNVIKVMLIKNNGDKKGKIFNYYFLILTLNKMRVVKSVNEKLTKHKNFSGSLIIKSE